MLYLRSGAARLPKIYRVTVEMQRTAMTTKVMETVITISLPSASDVSYYTSSVRRL